MSAAEAGRRSGAPSPPEASWALIPTTRCRRPQAPGPGPTAAPRPTCRSLNFQRGELCLSRNPWRRCNLLQSWVAVGPPAGLD